ncbi:unnamed protein product [Psylliodes chrysocephalus]|uniref:Cyclin N-terminal domain-containing protein n=1 Tax=Psylliodes chrysocephalus TaxID=3402493 RepID=A0A9P0G802_9CUCU|nr:unnamed protein product [Psylliodes chrysocephala]
MNYLSKYESNLLTEWLSEMLKNEGKYLEPILDTRSTILIKDICNMLKQDIHVFGFAVDTIEEYIARKSSRGEEIDDPALTLVSTIFICSKYLGDQDLKIPSLGNILKKVTGHVYEPKLIRLKEMEILTVLNHSLPINNNVEDLKAFVTKFEKESRIKVSILPICIEILELMYLTRKEWFYSLKKLYIISNEAMKVFKKLITSRFYLPIGILIYVFKNTSYSNTLDVDSILEDLANGSKIHSDHLNALVSKINEIMNNL